MLLAERLVGEARSRRAKGMGPRERVVLTTSAVAFLAAAVLVAVLLPNERDASVVLSVGLIAGYVLIERVRFEFGHGYGTAEQLILVPIVLLAPLPYVALMIALANAASMLPEVLEGRWHRQRVMGRIADLWYCLPPVLVIAALAPGTLSLEHWWVYGLAFIAQIAGDFTWTLLRTRLLDPMPFGQFVGSFMGSARVDAILAPIAFFVSLAALETPIVLLAIGPLAWLLHSFATDRKERYSKTLELQRAYRGTVMLLADVVEFEDDYTAQHSRSVVELVNAVADELGVPPDDRQELEFAALLHDVGKIAIPKEILNKPAKLTDGEFEVMKTHTIEGQFMLDRVGGLLGRVGEIVRSCHERWDGAGYPDGLKGGEIPLASRIVFACDAYHAITSDRAYRPARSKTEGIAELMNNAGGQFDPYVVSALVVAVEERELTMDAVGDEVRAVLASAPVRKTVSTPPGL